MLFYSKFESGRRLYFPMRKLCYDAKMRQEAKRRQASWSRLGRRREKKSPPSSVGPYILLREVFSTSYVHTLIWSDHEAVGRRL